ncbi:MAG: DUF2085 domain-containing protein [candidate division Zixibacteria bacterium]|nr:DUF2085 domain-containing protein [candidate division Zixibacteria bacterium]
MLLSHHAPADYDRTVVCLGVRMCSRCMGVLAGVLIAGFVWLHWQTHPCQSSVVLVGGYFMPVPAAIDFLSHEIGLRRSNNVIRFVTGILLGIAAALPVLFVIEGSFGMATMQAAWLSVIEILSGVVLKRTGCLEPYLRRYELGVRTLPDSHEKGPVANRAL